MQLVFDLPVRIVFPALVSISTVFRGGRSVSVAEFASHHYAVDRSCSLAHHLSIPLWPCLIPRSDDPTNTLGAGLCRTSENALKTKNFAEYHNPRTPVNSVGWSQGVEEKGDANDGGDFYITFVDHVDQLTHQYQLGLEEFLR